MKVFVFDGSKCNGCYNCQLACKDETVGNDWLPYSLSQPEVGHFWCKVQETTHGQTPRVRVEYKPMLCNHCENAPCIEAFPEVIYKREDGLVIIDPIKAKGVEGIEDACPYGYIYYNDDLGIAQKCTGCAHLVDRGEVPHCVDLCVSGALRFGDYEEFADELKDAEFFVDPAVGPHVYYINLPHLFVAGDVWDPEEDEIIEGAKVTIEGEGVSRTELTDDYGDFWFRGLLPGSYHLSIAAEGFKGRELDIELTESLNVGDFPLEK